MKIFLKSILIISIFVLIVSFSNIQIDANELPPNFCLEEFLNPREGGKIIGYEINAQPYYVEERNSRLDIGRSHTAHRISHMQLPGSTGAVGRVGTLRSQAWWETCNRRIVQNFGHSMLWVERGSSAVQNQTPRAWVDFRGRMATNNYRMILRGQVVGLDAIHWTDHVYNFHGVTYSWRADHSNANSNQ